MCHFRSIIPIYHNIHHIHLMQFRILWLPRPLIKRFPESSNKLQLLFLGVKVTFYSSLLLLIIISEFVVTVVGRPSSRSSVSFGFAAQFNAENVRLHFDWSIPPGNNLRLTASFEERDCEGVREILLKGGIHFSCFVCLPKLITFNGHLLRTCDLGRPVATEFSFLFFGTLILSERSFANDFVYIDCPPLKCKFSY